MNYLCLGSNLGDRSQNLRLAREKLSSRLDVTLVCSEILETEALGFDGEPFLNQVVAFEGEVDPLELLSLCQQIERELGRPAHEARYDASGRRVYENRVIDIDLLVCGDCRVSTARLTLPHPQCVTRPYVAALIATLPEEIQRQYKEQQ